MCQKVSYNFFKMITHTFTSLTRNKTQQKQNNHKPKTIEKYYSFFDISPKTLFQLWVEPKNGKFQPSTDLF